MDTRAGNEEPHQVCLGGDAELCRDTGAPASLDIATLDYGCIAKLPRTEYFEPRKGNPLHRAQVSRTEGTNGQQARLGQSLLSVEQHVGYIDSHSDCHIQTLL